jgi:hypothetical protein
MLRKFGSFSFTGLALLLGACGGGSGNDSASPRPVVVSASPVPPAGVVTNAYAGYTFSASGGSPPYAWAVTAGSLPGGLTLAPDGTLAGTPTAVGSFTFTVRATDSAQSPATGTQSFSIAIDAPAALSIDTGQMPPAGVHGAPYTFSFAATGGRLPLSWTVTAGALPPGLTLGPDGTISGTPTVASTTPYAFTISVADSGTPTPAMESGAYSIAISEPPSPEIASNVPPTAVVGSQYSFQFTASGGLGPLAWTPPNAPMGGLDFSVANVDGIGIAGILSGTPSTAGIYPITLTVTDALNQSSPVTPFIVRVAKARPPGAFTSTGSMHFARSGHTATLLIDGRVLVAGGGVAEAELYDPASRSFTVTGSMTLAKDQRSATLLADPNLPNYGKVLLVGGGDTVAQLYDPKTGTFSATGSTLTPHLGQTATLLQDGRVLVAGGETASAELYDPATGKFTATGGMTISRSAHTATLLADGRVLIAGGAPNVGPGIIPVPLDPSLASAELYDPTTGKFSSTGSMRDGRAGETATLLADGTVLVTALSGDTELFDPATATFSPVEPLTRIYRGITATLRNDGTILVISPGLGASLYAPECQGFVSAGSPTAMREEGFTATLLSDGAVLVAGGARHDCVLWVSRRGCVQSVRTVLSSAELFK